MKTTFNIRKEFPNDRQGIRGNVSPLFPTAVTPLVNQTNPRSLLEKVEWSLQRDRDLSFWFKVRKASVFFTAMLTAWFSLSQCDRVGKRPRTRTRPYIVNMGRITIGDDFNLNSRIVRSELATGPDGLIDIGNEVHINFGALLSAQSLVKIGDRVQIGPYAIIADSDFHTPFEPYRKPAGIPIVIEDDVWISSRVTVLKGVRIGRGAIIAAGSVVTHNIPAFTLAAGSPARVVRVLEVPQSFEKV